MISETELQNARDAKEVALLDLFDNWPSAALSAENIKAYLVQIEPFSVEAVRRSVQQFGAGLVERDMRFPPPAPEFAANVREWQRALDSRNAPAEVLHNGLLEVDFGQGRINMRGLTAEEQDRIIAAKGVGPDGRSLAYQPTEAIRQALAQPDLAQVEGGKSFRMPALRGME